MPNESKSNEEPMVEIKQVDSSARCDMCSRRFLMLNTNKDSTLYLCRSHRIQFEKTIREVEAREASDA